MQIKRERIICEFRNVSKLLRKHEWKGGGRGRKAQSAVKYCFIQKYLGARYLM